MPKVKAAAVQATPVFLNKAATVQKACTLIDEAASNGAGLIVFPETFIPVYPDWVWRAPPGRARSVSCTRCSWTNPSKCPALPPRP